MRILVAGWFSIKDGGATAGDLLVQDTICGWLQEHNIQHDVALERALGPGVDWFRVSPSRYTHLIFACGPVSSDLVVAQLIERFASCRRIAINVSLVGDPSWQPFDLLLQRDDIGAEARSDLSITRPARRTPVVAIVQVGRQTEYSRANPEIAHIAFDRLLSSREAATFAVDTILHPRVPGRRTAAEVQALLARADVVLTTRLHGLVLALTQGVPVVAVDPIHGGAKVLAQARILDWPASMTVDTLDDATLERHFEWCLTPAARQMAQASRVTGLADAEKTHAALTEYLRPQARRSAAYSSRGSMELIPKDGSPTEPAPTV